MPSEPHIEMTVEALRDAGVVIDDGDANTWRVEPSEINALDVQVEPDLSNAAPFLAAALVTGGSVRVPGWPQHTTQAGDAIRDILDAMGADVSLDRAGLTVTGSGQLERARRRPARRRRADPGRRRRRRAGRLALLAARHRAPARARDRPAGRPGRRDQRPRRLASSETEDGLRITPAPLHGGLFHTYDDHRMAMAGAVLGLRVARRGGRERRHRRPRPSPTSRSGGAPWCPAAARPLDAADGA